jgi:signal transduction histidine kinase
VLSYTKDKKNDPVVNKGSVYVKRALEMVERVLPADVRVEFHDNASGINISADQGRITQLLINLCQNASDAMDGKGVITVKVYVVEKPFGHFFCISVKDTGCGIPEDQKDKIYKPFYTTKKDKGTGLGLANVRQIVMEMGGMIDVESSPEGTEFTLMFSESK